MGDNVDKLIAVYQRADGQMDELLMQDAMLSEELLLQYDKDLAEAFENLINTEFLSGYDNMKRLSFLVTIVKKYASDNNGLIDKILSQITRDLHKVAGVNEVPDCGKDFHASTDSLN